jgi:hypothetical protein
MPVSTVFEILPFLALSVLGIATLGVASGALRSALRAQKRGKNRYELLRSQQERRSRRPRSQRQPKGPRRVTHRSFAHPPNLFRLRLDFGRLLHCGSLLGRDMQAGIARIAPARVVVNTLKYSHRLGPLATP